MRTRGRRFPIWQERETNLVAIGRVDDFSDSDSGGSVVSRFRLVFFFGGRLRRIRFAVPEVRERVREVLVAMSIGPFAGRNEPLEERCFGQEERGESEVYVDLKALGHSPAVVLAKVEPRGRIPRGTTVPELVYVPTSRSVTCTFEEPCQLPHEHDLRREGERERGR